ncbi:MAG: rhodanese-like domain-containing protein [Deltaproteobacteria bacterium]|nr:MAG: rhodanese-like domain-containing protein [Deltaproteobacteria bacterium]
MWVRIVFVVWFASMLALGCASPSPGPEGSTTEGSTVDAASSSPDQTKAADAAETTDTTAGPEPGPEPGPEAGPEPGPEPTPEPAPEATRAKVLKDVSTQEANVLLQQKPDMAVLDIRTPAEYNGGHLANAINIDYYAQDYRDKLSKLDKNKAYLIYCASGGRSGNSMSIFRDLGFVEVYNMLGGFTAWKRDGYPSVP